MSDYHVVLVIVAVALEAVGSGTYISSVMRGVTKPHVYTWLAYVLLDGTVFIAQLRGGGGIGAWVLGISALFNVTIFLLAVWRGEKHVVILDRVCLAGSLLGIVLWWATKDPFSAVVLATLTNTVALIPTFRKSYARPNQESISVWAVDILRFGLSVVSLEVRTLTTVLFPVGIMVANGVLVCMILIRRRQLASAATAR